MTLDGRISVTPQALYAMANDIEAHASRIEASLHNASHTLDMLVGNGTFQGDSASVLVWRYHNIRGQMSRMPDRVRAYAQRIRLAAEAIERADQMRGTGTTALMCVAPTFLTSGGAWIIRRKDGITYYFYRDRYGKEHALPEGFTPEEGLQILDQFGDQIVGGFEEGFDLKLQYVSASHRADEYMRHLPGWKGISKKLGTAGDLIDAGLIGYSGYRWAVGENGDYYQSANIGVLGNGTQIVHDKYIARDVDEDTIGGLGSIGGGWLAAGGATAVAAYVVGAPVTVPATIAVGAFIFVAGVLGSHVGEQVTTSAWQATLDYDPIPQSVPTTDLRFTAQGVEGRAAHQSMTDGGRIDLERLLDSDGEVVLQRDANGRLVAQGGVTGAPAATVYLE